jgi:hypothetical protein
MDKKPYSNEKLLQSLLEEHPDLLAGDQIKNPTLNTHVPQNKGTYVANEKRELSTLRILFFMGKGGGMGMLQAARPVVVKSEIVES